VPDLTGATTATFTINDDGDVDGRTSPGRVWVGGRNNADDVGRRIDNASLTTNMFGLVSGAII
jgi:hypothetical protein